MAGHFIRTKIIVADFYLSAISQRRKRHPRRFLLTSSRPFEGEKAKRLPLASSKPPSPRARPPGHGRAGGNRESVERSPSALDLASENNYSRDLMFKAALTPRCFQRTAAKPRSHPKPKTGARVWPRDRPSRGASDHAGRAGGSPALEPAVLKNGG